MKMKNNLIKKAVSKSTAGSSSWLNHNCSQQWANLDQLTFGGAGTFSISSMITDGKEKEKRRVI